MHPWDWRHNAKSLFCLVRLPTIEKHSSLVLLQWWLGRMVSSDVIPKLSKLRCKHLQFLLVVVKTNFVTIEAGKRPRFVLFRATAKERPAKEIEMRAVIQATRIWKRQPPLSEVGPVAQVQC